jgi:hypothetical protein
VTSAVALVFALVLAFVFLLAAVVVSAALDSPAYVTASLLVLTALSLLTLLAAVAQDLKLVPAWREREPGETSKPPSSRLSEPEKSSVSRPASPPLDQTVVANARPPSLDEDTLDEETQPAETSATLSRPDREPGAPGTYKYPPETRPER